jgi:hypothetical protein
VAQLLIPHSLESRVGPRPRIVVEMVSPAPRDIWRGVLRDDPGATAHQTPEYFDAVVGATGGTDGSRFYQLRDGRQLLLPLVRRPSRFGLHLDASYPDGYGPGGMLATGGLLADDVRMVVKDLRGESLSARIGGAHHTREQWAAGLLPGVTEERHPVGVINLAPGQGGDVEAFRSSHLHGETRQRLRRAARLGIEVEKDTTGRLVGVFYDIYRAWLEREIHRSGLPPLVARRRALRAEPQAKFAAVATGTGDACRVFVGWYRGRPVAASILLVHGHHASRWRSYSVPELAAPVCADLLTQVTGIEDAVSSGCRSIDLVECGGVENRQHDRNSLGASAGSVVDLRIEPAGLARLRAAGARAEGVLVRALTRSPASSTLGQPMP